MAGERQRETRSKRGEPVATRLPASTRTQYSRNKGHVDDSLLSRLVPLLPSPHKAMQLVQEPPSARRSQFARSSLQLSDPNPVQASTVVTQFKFQLINSASLAPLFLRPPLEKLPFQLPARGMSDETLRPAPRQTRGLVMAKTRGFMRRRTQVPAKDPLRPVRRHNSFIERANEGKGEGCGTGSGLPRRLCPPSSSPPGIL